MTASKGVKLGGVMVKRVTAHNAKYVWDNKIGPGSIIKITRSGDVIPYILEVIKGSRKPQMPDVPWKWDTNKMHAYLNGEEEQETVEALQISHFFSTMEVDNLGYGIICRLYAAGLDDVIKIIKAGPKEYMKADGIQERMAVKIRQNIDKAMAKATLPQLMDASGAFGRGLGQTRLTALVKRYPKLMDSPQTKEDLYDMAISTPTFSDKMATLFVTGFPTFVKLYKRLGLKLAVEHKVRTVGQKLKGHTVAFTGFRDKALAELIVKQGGLAKDSIGKDTTILLVSRKGSGSAKEKAAEARGIKIMVPAEFLKKFGLTL